MLNNIDVEKKLTSFSLSWSPHSPLVFSQVYGRVPWRLFPRVSLCVGIRGPLQHETAETSFLKETWPSVLFSSQSVHTQNHFACFFTFFFVPLAQHFCRCLVDQLTSNQISSTLFCIPFSKCCKYMTHHSKLGTFAVCWHPPMFLGPDIFTFSTGKFFSLWLERMARTNPVSLAHL